jgi:hypothetical protein
MTAYTPRYQGPIQVAVVDEGGHFIEGAVDSRLQVGLCAATPAPDIVVQRGWRADKIAQAPVDVPRAAFERIVAGQATLVFDASGEGPAFDLHTAGTLHRMLREIGIPPERTVYLTQNRAWGEVYSGFCYAMSVQPVQVLHYDYYIRNFFRNHEADGEAAFNARLAAFEGRAAQREKRFVCLNNNPRPAKVLLLLKLLAGGQYDQGFVSFPGFDKTINAQATKRTAVMMDALALRGLESVAAKLMPFIHQLAAKGSIQFGAADPGAIQPAHYTPLANDAGLDEYNRAWFTVVTESEIEGPRRITEKPFKPLANFSPYINFGNPGSLALVREFGFRTFGEVFDESYDTELDVRRRFQMIHDEIARLCAIPEAELRAIEATLAETLVFNARRALIEMPALYRDVLEPQLIDRIMDVRTAG